AHERQVRMQDQGQVAAGHGRTLRHRAGVAAGTAGTSEKQLLRSPGAQPRTLALLTGRGHATWAAAGGLSAGSCGCACTSPRYCVPRLNFSSALRLSVPSEEVA